MKLDNDDRLLLQKAGIVAAAFAASTWTVALVLGVAVRLFTEVAL
jgi:hypothetical protein